MNTAIELKMSQPMRRRSAEAPKHDWFVRLVFPGGCSGQRVSDQVFLGDVGGRMCWIHDWPGASDMTSLAQAR